MRLTLLDEKSVKEITEVDLFLEYWSRGHGGLNPQQNYQFNGRKLLKTVI